MQHRSRRFNLPSVIQILLLVVLILLVGCTNGSSRTDGNDDGFTTIRVLGGSDPYLDPLITAFQDKHPTIRVEKVAVDSQASPPGNMIRLPVAEGKVDVVPASWVPWLVQDNLLAALDPYLQRDKADWAPLGNLDNLRLNGRLYGMPVALYPYVLLYNQALCEQAGVEVPQQPWTWPQFRDAANKLTRKDSDGQTWGFAYPYPQQLVELYVLQQTAGVRWADDEAAIKAGLRFFTEMIFTDRSAPPMGEVDEATGRPEIPVGTSFIDGRVAMTMGIVGALNGIGNSYFPVGAAPVPVLEGKQPVMVATPRSYAIAAKAAAPEAAWQFLRFMAGPEGAAVVAQSGFMPAYRTHETLDQWLASSAKAPAGLRGLADLPVRLVESNINRPGGINDWVVFNATVPAMQGKTSWEQAFEEYQSKKVGAR